jgi:hypothetical protein
MIIHLRFVHSIHQFVIPEDLTAAQVEEWMFMTSYQEDSPTNRAMLLHCVVNREEVTALIILLLIMTSLQLAQNQTMKNQFHRRPSGKFWLFLQETQEAESYIWELHAVAMTGFIPATN